LRRAERAVKPMPIEIVLDPERRSATVKGVLARIAS
jgi:hypothetical protein